MADVAVVGGGPAGLAAALFTAKNGLETVVFDTNETGMNKAHLFNYLGFRSIGGEEFMTLARGQVRDRGAELRPGVAVTAVEETADGFELTTDADESVAARYVVFATGADTSLPESLGCALTPDDDLEVDLTMRTSVEHVYATGRLVRSGTRQASIAAGDGAAAAVDIIQIERDEPGYHDYDYPTDVPDL